MAFFCSKKESIACSCAERGNRMALNLLTVMRLKPHPICSKLAQELTGPLQSSKQDVQHSLKVKTMQGSRRLKIDKGYLPEQMLALPAEFYTAFRDLMLNNFHGAASRLPPKRRQLQVAENCMNSFNTPRADDAGASFIQGWDLSEPEFKST